MRRVKFYAVAAALGLAFVVVSAPELAHSQDGPSPQTASKAMSIAFEHSGLNTEGNPTAVEEAQIDLVSTAGAVVKSIKVPASAGTVTAPLAGLVETASAGGYAIRVRVRGENGIWSAYAPDMPVTVDNSQPSAPTGIRVEISVTVNVTTGG